MINIYRSRESVDKEKFIYDAIKTSGNRTLVIVPDQYTLAAERQAMDRLNTSVLLQVEVTGISRLGSRLLEETGDKSKTVINRYGRHMLISKIVRDMEDQLLAFKGFGKRETFIEAVNNFISAAKLHETSPGALAAIATKAQKDLSQGAFARKLHDLALVFSEYQKRIQGKYTDNEDLLDLYIEAASESKEIPKMDIWVYGFDSYTPKNISFIIALAQRAPCLNLHLTYDENSRDEDLFTLSGNLTKSFQQKAKEKNIEVFLRDLKEGENDVPLNQGRKKGLVSLEKELFSVGKSQEDCWDGVEIVSCGNLYTEAEGAAAYVLKLLREENYRYRDIVIICNDQVTRGPILSRVFNEYGMDLFDDRKRDALGSPLSVYAMSLLDILAFGYRIQDILRFIKTGLLDISDGDLEELENYAFKYKIKGNQWREPFTRGSHEGRYEGGLLEQIENTRKLVMEKILSVEDLFHESNTYEDFSRGYKGYLKEELLTEEKVQELIRKQEEVGLKDLADETDQVGEIILELLDQIGEIMGEAPLDGEDFATLLRSGLSQIEVGVLPPSGDDIMLGTMQRTRSGDVKALLVIGANDDLIPRAAQEDILFSREELTALSEEGQDFGLDSNLRLMEENLAIYRNLSKPKEHLRISYASLDQNAKELRPSEIIKSIKNIFPKMEETQDPILSGNLKEIIGGHVNTLRRFSEAKRKEERGVKISPLWKTVEDWLRNTDDESLEKINQALSFDNVQEPLPEELAMGLFARSFNSAGEPIYKFSPTALERYSRCPFSFFMNYALRPEELRVDEIDPRDIGDLYHNTLQRFTEEIGKAKRWDTIEREEADRMVETMAKEWAHEYRSSLFEKEGNESYRLKRGIKVCKYIAWILVEQAREGKIKESYFEIPFGPKMDKDEITLKPIEKELSFGKAYIQGKIDRVDILEDDRVKIIDYKTGRDSISLQEVASGYRLQLMLYLQAAQEEVRKPAGVFYFLISEPEVELTGSPKDSEGIVNDTLESAYRMEGLMLENDTVIREVAGEFTEASKVVKLKRKKDGELDKNSLKRLVGEEDFHKLQETVDQITTDICNDITRGRIDISPKAIKDRTACDYCSYKSVCRFDPVFQGNDYR